MTRSRYSKRASRHAKESKQRTKKMLKGAAAKSGPVTVSYLPGYGPEGKLPAETFREGFQRAAAREQEKLDRHAAWARLVRKG